MVRRTFILFAIFSAFAVGALLFMMAYNGILGSQLQSYVLRIRRCEFLSEAMCARHPGCQAYYETSSATPDRPEFRECRYLTAQVVKANGLCGSTGGQWLGTKFGPYCQCPVGRQYIVDKGCQ